MHAFHFAFPYVKDFFGKFPEFVRCLSAKYRTVVNREQIHLHYCKALVAVNSGKVRNLGLQKGWIAVK